MYPVSDEWVAAQRGFLTPEGFVELSCYIPELKNSLVLTKSDLLSFSHQQTGSLVSGELPKNHIEFSLDNSNGRWDPSNPTGMERYLSERLAITVRYGFDVNGVIEWIPGGIFYLTEWRTSPNGLEASFKARDVLEYMMNQPYTGEVSGTLYHIVERAIAEARIPDTIGVNLSNRLTRYSVGDIEYSGDESVAEVIQKCANAAGCVMYQDRNGVFNVTKLPYDDSGFVVAKDLSYSYPEVDFYRPMKNVSVKYQDDNVVLYQFGSSGETQSLTNEFISTKNQAIEIAKWICYNLRTRILVSGDFRGDPRLDLFDMVLVESKYGQFNGVVLTDLKCSFTGAFKMKYTGYSYGNGTAVFAYSGNDIFAGEVI